MAFDVVQVIFFVLLEHHCLELYFHVVHLLFYWNVKVLQDVPRVELFGHLFVFLLEVDQFVHCLLVCLCFAEELQCLLQNVFDDWWFFLLANTCLVKVLDHSPH
jgi:hypothetical protein